MDFSVHLAPRDSFLPLGLLKIAVETLRGKVCIRTPEEIVKDSNNSLKQFIIISYRLPKVTNLSNKAKQVSRFH